MDMDPLIKDIMNDVFVATGEQLEPKEPLMAVMLAQYRFFRETLVQQLAEHDAERRAFVESFSQQTETLTQSVEQLYTYRKELLLELLAQNKQALDDTEDRLYAAINAKVSREQQTQLADWWHSRQRWLLAATVVCATASLASLLVLLAVLFK